VYHGWSRITTVQFSRRPTPTGAIDIKAWRRGRGDSEVVRYIKDAISREGTVEFWGFGRTARRQMIRVGYALGQEGFGVLFGAEPYRSIGRTELRIGTEEGLDAHAVSWPRPLPEGAD